MIFLSIVDPDVANGMIQVPINKNMIPIAGMFLFRIFPPFTKYHLTVSI